MIARVRQLFRRSAPRPDVEAFVERTRASRQDANAERKAAMSVTRQLRAANASWADRPVVDRFRGSDQREEGRR